MSGLSNFRETFQPRRPPRRRSLLPAVEGLDQRALLMRASATPSQGHVAEVRREHDFEHNGTVVKRPRFYEDYVGPRSPSWMPWRRPAAPARWQLPFRSA